MCPVRISTMFQGSNTNIQQLHRALTEPVRYIVGYEPYLKQVGLDTLFTETNPNAASIMLSDYIQRYGVNASNNLGMTLLHVLIWASRPDLALTVIQSPQFEKINYKFSIPAGHASMYASALDLAIGLYLEKQPGFTLEFLEHLLKHGARLPKPAKKFLNEEFATFFYPLMVRPVDTDVTTPAENDAGIGMCSKEELTQLFCLMHRYHKAISGEQKFSIQIMLDNLTKRMFSTLDDADNRAAEFEEKYHISIAEQRRQFDAFFEHLLKAVSDITSPGALDIEMTDARRDDGQSTLSLPFNPHERACSIM